MQWGNCCRQLPCKLRAGRQQQAAWQQHQSAWPQQGYLQGQQQPVAGPARKKKWHKFEDRELLTAWAG